MTQKGRGIPHMSQFQSVLIEDQEASVQDTLSLEMNADITGSPAQSHPQTY